MPNRKAAESRPLQARLAAINNEIERQGRVRDRAPAGSNQRKRATTALRALNTRRKELRKDRWKMKGSTAIIKYEVIPVLEDNGIPVTSRKRWATFGNSSSDHYMGNRDADAVDGGTFANNDRLGSEIKAALTDDPSASVRGFAEFTITRRHIGSAESYRIQIITEQHGTGPHIHIGVKRVS